MCILLDPDNHMLAYVTRRIETECNELQRNFEPFVAILSDMVRYDDDDRTIEQWSDKTMEQWLHTYPLILINLSLVISEH